MQFDEIYELIGQLDTFQMCIVFIVCFMSAFDADSVTMIFVGGSMKHFCRVDRLANLSYSRQKEIAVPTIEGAASNGEYSSCRVFEFDFDSLKDDELASWNRSLINESWASVDCSAWVFDQSEFVSTIVSRFSLVCDKAILVQIVTTVYMIGSLFGSFLAGHVSDRFGRRRALQIFLSIRIAGATLSTFGPDYPTFLVGRFILGFGGSGSCIVAYTQVMEMVGPRYRSACMTAVFIMLSCGIVNMALIASAVRDDLKYQLVFFAPQLFNLLCLFTIMPESPRWLFVRKRFDELNQQLRRIATINGKTIPNDFDSRNFDRQKEDGGKPPGCFALFLTPRIRLWSLIVIFEGFTVSLVYYALLLNVSTLPGNLYVNTCISGAVEIPAVVIGTLAAKSPLGRRLSSLTLLILCGLALLICIPLIIYDHETATTAMSLVGKIWIMAFYSILIVYTSELFPTQLRSVALGSVMMLSRIGGAVAPYIGENLIDVWQPLPSTLMGGLVTVAAGLVLLLPETQGKPISDTIDQIEGSDKIASRYF